MKKLIMPWHAMPLSQALLSVGIGFVCLLSGCTQNRSPELYYHVIQFDPDGNTVDPLSGRTFTNAETNQQFADILGKMKSDLGKKPDPKVIVYVHGGLNSPDDAIELAQEHIKDIIKQDSSCYPVFVIWDSSLSSTYYEHLFKVRQGRNDTETRVWAMFDFPIYFLSDFLVAIARAPTVWLQQGSTDTDSVAAGLTSIASYGKTQKDLEKTGATTRPAEAPDHAELWLERKREVNAAAFYLVLNRLYYEDSKRPATQPTTQISISIGADHSQPSDWIGRGFVYALFLPFKLLTAPIIDGLGTPAWRDMGRRAQTIVDGSSGFTVSSETTASEIADYVDRGTDGGLDLFITELAGCARPDKDATTPTWQVTLIAHSAGAIVLNEVLRRQIQREVKGGTASLPVRNIVYLAPACTIRDFTESVIPFMELKSHRQAKFFDLTLHPSAEMVEAEAWELVPRGSLLCWIDDFLTSPQTPLDRTLGRWDNIVQTPYVFPPSLRGRVAIKAFTLERWGASSTSPIAEPQIHGDFTDSPFWDPGFWKPGAPLSLDDPRIAVAEMEKEKLKATAPHAVNGPSN